MAAWACGKVFREKRTGGKKPSRIGQTEVGRRKSQGNNGEDAKLMSVAPESGISHRASLALKGYVGHRSRLRLHPQEKESKP